MEQALKAAKQAAEDAEQAEQAAKQAVEYCQVEDQEEELSSTQVLVDCATQTCQIEMVENQHRCQHQFLFVLFRSKNNLEQQSVTMTVMMNLSSFTQA